MARLGRAQPFPPHIKKHARPTSCEVTGTATATIDEADVAAGGETIILALFGDIWVADGGTFNAERQAIINGLDAASSPALGWNDEVRDKEVVTAVVRTDDRTVTITLTTAASAYDISAQETITVTVPASALALGVAVISTPTFTVDVVSGTVVKDRVGRGVIAFSR